MANIVKFKTPVNRLPQTQEEMTRRYREPDEDLEEVQRVIAEYVKGHNDLYRAYADIAAAIPCAFQTVKRLAEGVTRHPGNSTCTRILKVCGWRRQLVRIDARKRKTA